MNYEFRGRFLIIDSSQDLSCIWPTTCNFTGQAGLTYPTVWTHIRCHPGSGRWCRLQQPRSWRMRDPKDCGVSESWGQHMCGFKHGEARWAAVSTLPFQGHIWRIRSIRATGKGDAWTSRNILQPSKCYLWEVGFIMYWILDHRWINFFRLRSGKSEPAHDVGR